MKGLALLFGALVVFPAALTLCLVRDGIDHVLLDRYRAGPGHRTKRDA